MRHRKIPADSIYPAPYAGNSGSTNGPILSAHYHFDFWEKRQEATAAANAQLMASQAEITDASLLLETAIAGSYIDLDLLWQTSDLALEAVANRLLRWI